ncbi:MAG: Flp pilus assembly protein CpaB [Dehalococcoidia bacterium]
MRAIRKVGSGSVLMLLAVVLGLATASATFAWISGQESPDDLNAAAVVPSDDVPNFEVVVVVEDVAAGTRLPALALTTRRVTQTEMLQGAHTVPSEIAGRITRYPLLAGEQVIESKLVGDDGVSGRGLAYAVAPGMRAVSVPVSEVSGAGGLMIPGDRVDVMVVTTHSRVFGPEVEAEVDQATLDAGLDDENTVVTVLQDVLVLAVGQVLTPPADGGRDPATLRVDEADPQPSAHSVTLAVTPEQSQALFIASQEGPLGFAVRAFGDGGQGTLRPLSRVQPAPGVPDQVNRP